MDAASAKARVDMVLTMSRSLIAAQAEAHAAWLAYRANECHENLSRLKAARLESSKLSLTYDAAVRHAFAEDVFRARRRTPTS